MCITNKKQNKKSYKYELHIQKAFLSKDFDDIILGILLSDYKRSRKLG